MKPLHITAALVAAVAIMSAAPADAQTEKSKPGKAMQDRSQDAVDRAEMERENLPQRDKKSRERVEDSMQDRDYMGDDDLEDDAAGQKSGKAKDKSAKMKDKSAKGLDNAATRGNEKSQEMRARRDERKAIKEEYKASGKGGEGELDADDVPLGADADEAPKDSEKKEKKPWWKFWNQ